MTLEQITSDLFEAIKLPFSYFTSSDKRIYFLYLISALAISFVVFKKTKKKGTFLNYAFNKKIWLSKSAWIDYGFILLNGFIKVFLIFPYLILAKYFAFYIDEYLSTHTLIQEINLSKTATIFIYTLVVTVTTDFTSFITHYAFHKVPFLWRFHKVHHSATTLNPITQYRIHPVELIVNNIMMTTNLALITGVFDFLSPFKIEMTTILGANIFSFVFHIAGSNLRHSHVKLSYFSFLEYIFISPVQHQIHHSNKPEHYDKNMGSRLALWDWIFGTLIRSKEIKELKFGLGEEDKFYKNFIQNIVNPFRKQKK